MFSDTISGHLSVYATQLQTHTEHRGLQLSHIVGPEVLTAVVMNAAIFWDIPPYSPLRTDVSEEHITSIFEV
jgi:hypothetical protein